MGFAGLAVGAALAGLRPMYVYTEVHGKTEVDLNISTQL